MSTKAPSTFEHDVAAIVSMNGAPRPFPRVGAWCRVPGDSRVGIIAQIFKRSEEENGRVTQLPDLAEVHFINDDGSTVGNEVPHYKDGIHARDGKTGEPVTKIVAAGLRVPADTLVQADREDIPESRQPRVVEFAHGPGKKKEDPFELVAHTLSDEIDQKRLDNLGYKSRNESRVAFIARTLRATLVVPNNGEGLALKNWLNHTAPQNWVLCLYKSNTTPAETDTFATYTEATFTGYANATLTGSSWTISEGAPSSASYAQQTFTSTANQTTENQYGYVCKQTTSGVITVAERFTDAPYPITNNGDAIKITPAVTAD